MRIAVRSELPGPEGALLTDVLKDRHEVVELLPWDVRSHAVAYDVAICIGPVSSCPVARSRVLLAYGMMESQMDADWTVVGTFSEAARDAAIRRFGHGRRYVEMPPYVADIQAGVRQMREPLEGEYLLHISEFGWMGTPTVQGVARWAKKEPPGPLGENGEDKKPGTLFDAREVNGLIRTGAIGVYPGWMTNGYEMQARRHLSLGGKLVCPLNRTVLGHLTDACFPTVADAVAEPAIETVECSAPLEDFVAAVNHLMSLL